MGIGRSLREIDVVRMTVLLALVAIPAVAVLALAVAALSAPGSAPVVVATPVDTPTPTPKPMPTPTPVPLVHRTITGGNATNASNTTQGTNTSMSVVQSDGRATRNIAYAYQAGVSGITHFTAYWTVPERPKFNGVQNHTIFLWTGVQQGNLGLVQAVLEWDHDDTGRYWTLACWAVDHRDGTYRVSARVFVYPGDRIRAELRYEDDPAVPGRKVWHITMTDETHGLATELVDTHGTVDTNRDVIVLSGVLEGIGYVFNDIDLPGDTTFDGITYRGENGGDIPVRLTGYVDPLFPRVAVDFEEAGTPVTIFTHYGRTPDNTVSGEWVY